MPKNFARKTYDHWIKKNRKRFKYPPYIIESRKDIYESYLENKKNKCISVLRIKNIDR